MEKQNKVCIVGAGYISHFHIEALRLIPNVEIVGIFDVKEERARSVARKWGIKSVYASIDDLISHRSCDFAHVLVPPDMHRETAMPFLLSGIHVFLEKPMAVTAQECEELITSAKSSGAKLGINHNFVFHPSYLAMKRCLESRSLGGIHHIISFWNVPLRQLASKQFGHWMFQAPQNIILEQGVHPISQIYDLVGKMLHAKILATGRRDLGPETVFYDTWQISMICEKATAQLFLSFGQEFLSTGMTVICEDGRIDLDFSNNRFTVEKKTRWPEFFNSFVNGMSGAKQLLGQSIRNTKDYFFSIARIQPRSDAFFVSMKDSIRSFYKAIETDAPFVDGNFGLEIIRTCERIGAEVYGSAAAKTHPKISIRSNEIKPNILVLGGTGFIGRHLVRRMLNANFRIKVVARNTRGLPELFYDPHVSTAQGDISDKDFIFKITKDVPVVIHMATGGVVETWDEINRSMVEGTRNVAEACLANGVDRLLYVGSIASLYLGDPHAIITGGTEVDPHIEERALYSRGKGTCERLLKDLHKERGLPVCILRLGVVVGEGGIPLHSGIGWFNQDTYCVGWNDGTNSLPLVLVEDVAEAIFLAVQAKNITGKTYNVVGDVRMTAREYIRELSRVLGRRLHYLPQSSLKFQMVEIGKWFVKVGLQRRKVPFPSYRDLKSRGLVSRFDCSDIKRDLNWEPEQRWDEFIRRGIEVYRKEKRLDESTRIKHPSD